MMLFIVDVVRGNVVVLVPSNIFLPRPRVNSDSINLNESGEHTDYRALHTESELPLESWLPQSASFVAG